MKPISRRHFIQTGFIGAAAISAGLPGSALAQTKAYQIDKVKLGKTGLTVPRLALGTGTHGGNQSSDMTRMGVDNWLKVARYAQERGVTFYDSADLYGSHQNVKEILKSVPREKATVLSKIWTKPEKWNPDTPSTTIDRFRKETGSEYFDIMLLHCMTNAQWQEEKKPYIEALSEAKQKGIIKAHGVSCHNFEALKLAAEDPWVDIILARINPAGLIMDASADEVMAVLKKAHDSGKGIMGMKIFGEGRFSEESQREKSLRYAIGSRNVDCMTIGMTTTEQVDDAVTRIMRIVSEG
ncbi:MAG TPA: aldo/keto reductase [Prolixibacteraceae bacterium]|nr:aldo/keto reductase [Prolixibacteraceae bacterium]